jgi:hypothetical protein
MSAVTISEAWPGFGSAFTVAELDRMPDDGHLPRCEINSAAHRGAPVWVTIVPTNLTKGLPR